MGALRQDNTLFVANIHKVRPILESVPDLQPLLQ